MAPRPETRSAIKRSADSPLHTPPTQTKEIIRRQTEALIAVRDSITTNTQVLQKCHDNAAQGRQGGIQ